MLFAPSGDLCCHTFSRLRFLLLTCLFVWVSLFSLSAGIQPSQVPNVQLSERNRHVVDMSGTLSAGEFAQLDRACVALRETYGLEVAVVLLDAIDHENYTINTFSNELYQLWKLGSREDDFGLLIVSEMKGENGTRDFRIETGYGAEPYIPDALAMRIARSEIFPRFREGRVTEGLLAGLNAIDAELSRVGYQKGQDRKQTLSSNSVEGAAYLNGSIALAVYLLLSLLLYIRSISIVKQFSMAQIGRRNSLTLFRASAVSPDVFLFFLPAWPFYLYWYKKKEKELMSLAISCPHCGAQGSSDSSAVILDEGQIREKALGTAGHRTFHCNTCGYSAVESIPISREVERCPSCHYYTALPVRSRVQDDSKARMSASVRKMRCEHCFYEYERTVSSQGRTEVKSFAGGFWGGFVYILIAILQALMLGGRGGRGGGSGSSGRGGWGGGSSGGGGFSDKW